MKKKKNKNKKPWLKKTTFDGNLDKVTESEGSVERGNLKLILTVHSKNVFTHTCYYYSWMQKYTLAPTHPYAQKKKKKK